MNDPELGSVLITGGSSGLGEAVTHTVAEAGGCPVVLDRKPPTAEFDHELVDLHEARATEAAVATVIERHQDLSGVVTAAGIDACGRLEDVDPSAWDDVVRVNLLGTAAVIRASLSTLERNHGTVVTVASTLGLRPLSDASAYCASKFGVVGMTRALAIELAGRVGVTLLVPGGMRTAFFEGRDPQYQPGPDAELNDPAHVAAAALFALRQPLGCEIRELVVCPSGESSWP